ncbi:zinc finger and SCAN domain-containing protein 31-like isoform X2 [Culex pipiens pallens]|uniref:zinc finger and SCAN domain-containing protein 31-like isoform X2 n=1 Tax=Culex pipiens pallens TaxID=42434 RepID=UPI0022AB3329|nr:zinc finger and SCAN domain-containing protein 31-like isoform X2 [Culex pipiens pallens]
MSLALIQQLASSDVCCRFCLQHSSDQPLSAIYEPVPSKPSIITINTTIRNVLVLLGIQISQNDPYPNLICSTCRNLLFSIEKFKETARESVLALDKARLLREFPTVKFDEVTQASPQEASEEFQVGEIVVEVEECPEKVEEVQEPEVFHEEDSFYLEEVEPTLKEEVDEAAASEYAETEWITYDEEPEEGGCTVEQLEEPNDEDDTETIYLEEELEQENEPEEEPNPNQPTKKGNICPICGKTSTAMVVHMRIHTNTRPFTCDQCPKAYFTRNKLKVHVESVHFGARPHACEICLKSFALRKTLNAHMQSHLTEADMEFGCDGCPKKFAFRWALEKHRRAVHTGERPFVCTLDGCGKSFASSSNLRQHQKTNAHWSADQPRRDVCGDCGVEFKTKYALRAHRKVAHPAAKVKVVERAEYNPASCKRGRRAGCPDEAIFSALSHSPREYLEYRGLKDTAQKHAFLQQLSARIGFKRRPKALSLFLKRKQALIDEKLKLEFVTKQEL